MSEKRSFFFDPELPQDESNPLFNALTSAGIVKDADERPLQVQADAQFQTKSSRLISLEYGIYQKDYSLHITPVHPKYNFDNKQKVNQAILAAVRIVAPAVATSLRIDVFKPREDWEVRVISLVIRGASKAWNFDAKEFEDVVIDRLMATLEEVVRS